MVDQNCRRPQARGAGQWARAVSGKWLTSPFAVIKFQAVMNIQEFFKSGGAMKRRLQMLFLLTAITLFPPLRFAMNQPPAGPVYVTLWFDTEDYILPQSDDAAKRLAETLTRLGVRATFKIVGEKARTLERRGRKDVTAAPRRFSPCAARSSTSRKRASTRCSARRRSKP